jgi:two-component system, cell cycle sensor histidine kinase and response regulator CckA
MMEATVTEPVARARVLVVEDEALIAEELRERLTRLGHSVIDIVDSGDRAIQSAAEHQPDLVLMDIRLRGLMDGVQATQTIRRRVRIPVVFLTAHSDRETVRRAMGTEPYGYVLKPFSERELSIAVEIALSRHRLERLLFESERRYMATLASIGDGVIATDAGGHVTFMNPVAEALTKWTLDRARGMTIDHVFALVDETTGASRENPAIPALRGHLARLTEPTLLVARDGDRIPIDDCAAPIVDETGALLGAVVAFRDARERRRADKALRQAEEQLTQTSVMESLGRLARGVAHDFNNVLTIILGSADMLQDTADLNSSQKQVLNDIRAAGQRGASLARQLLVFGRKKPLRRVALDLSHRLADVSRLLKCLIGDDIVLQLNLSPDLRMISADPDQIEQVLMNLAANARDAMPGGGRLTIETRNVDVPEGDVAAQPGMNPGRYVMLAVGDTGAGIDKTIRNHIFEPFFTTKKLGKGTGLGLATVYGIVKQSGGFIDVTSEAGIGTTFEMYFPELPSTQTVPLV